jgi:hypothetical protein
MLSNRPSILRTVQTGLWVPSSFFLCGHKRCSNGSKLAGTWKWPLTSRAKFKNVWRYSSTPPHTFVACARESLHYWGYISECISILSIHMRADKKEIFSKECNNNFQIIALFPRPMVQHNRAYRPIMLSLPCGPRTLNIIVLFKLFCECT